MFAEQLLLLMCAYAIVGTIVAIGFLARGIPLVDAAAREAPWSFRLIIFPGVVALWPLILRRWILATRRSGSGA